MVSSMVLWNTNQKVVKRLQNICIPCDATVFENQRKSRIQHCERSELRFYFEWTKVHKKCQNSQIWRVFQASGQTMLPDMSLF